MVLKKAFLEPGRGENLLEVLRRKPLAAILPLAEGITVTKDTPLYIDITWKNGILPEGETCLTGYFFGTYDAEAETFSIRPFAAEGVDYYWGFFHDDIVPAPGELTTKNAYGRAIDTGTWDVIALVSHPWANVTPYEDYGVKIADAADFILPRRKAERVETDILTVVVPAEITEVGVRERSE